MASLKQPTVGQIGALTETAPASDTASSGLNGRLQRVAQRISSLIALIPTALGAHGGFVVEGVASGVPQPISGTVTATGTLTVNPAAVATGGATKFHLVAVAGANLDKNSLKNGQATLYSVDIFNKASYPVYVKFHNTGSVPTPGSGVVLTVGIQAGVGRQVTYGAIGKDFSAGIGLTITKLIADSDTTQITADDCVVDVDFK